MKKFIKFLGFGLLVAIVFSIAGCSSDDENADNEAADNDYSEFPEKEIELIVPTAAGGGTDAIARALAPLAEENLGESIGVVNKTGGSGSVGMTDGANADPDGYTVTMTFVELTMFEHLGLSNLSPDEFKTIGLINLDPAALKVTADAHFDTMEEFIDFANKHLGDISL